MARPTQLTTLLVAVSVAGCTAMPPVPPPPPVAIGAGKGSEHGNYPTFATGAIHEGDTGPCPVFAWDRALSNGEVVRYLSAACPMVGRPGIARMVDLGHMTIPLAQSPLATYVPAPFTAQPVTAPTPTPRVTVAPLSGP